MKKILIRNGDIVSGEGVRRADILVGGGKIAQIADHIEETPDVEEVYDATDLFVFPGFIDGHTHLDMQAGVNHTADDFASGSIAAVSGGTTTVVDFATQEKGETLNEALMNWEKLAKGRSSCDYAFHMAITDWNEKVEHEIPQMRKKGVTSFKLYMAYDNLRVDDGIVYEVLRAVEKQGGVVGMHCENGDLIKIFTRELLAEGKTGPSSHPLSRPPIVEAEAIQRFLYLAELADAPVNIVHLSTKRGLDVILEARRRGQKVYIETCPQYLILTDEMYNLPGFHSAKYVLSPPLRSPENREALWQACRDNEIDTIGSDHCSFRYRDQKSVGRDDFSMIPNGAPGVDVRPALIYTYGVQKGRISIEQMCRLLAENPARLYGMYPHKGTISVGSDADIVIWEKSWNFELTDWNQKTAADYSPFSGMRVGGRAAWVFLRGELVAVNGEVVNPNKGEYVFRKPSEFWR